MGNFMTPAQLIIQKDSIQEEKEIGYLPGGQLQPNPASIAGKIS